jgi:broad specificity phosphatase PhoE
MMIYDIEGHIDHAINSPFTCYDWQKSEWFKGKKLQEIFPVENIYLRDFFEARRGSNEYLKDLKNNNISIRKYEIKKKKYFLKKINYKINTKNRGEFVFHIINNLINNYNKFYTNKNILISPKNFKMLFFKITNNNKSLWDKFAKLKKQKNNLTEKYSRKSISLAGKFLYCFNVFLKNESKKYKQITFLRHAKTSINDGTFLGQNRNPDILIRKLNSKPKKKYDLIYTSPLKRSISTAKLFNGKKIVISKYLNEINYGKAEGMSLKKYKIGFPKKVKMWKNAVDVKFPQGENTQDVKKRMFKFIKSEIYKKLNKKKISRILVVTHNVFLRCLVGYFLNIKIKNCFKININHLQKFEFLLKNNSIYPNFKRKDSIELLASLYD